MPAHDEAAPALGEVWTAWQPHPPATRGWRNARLAAAIGLALLLGGAISVAGAAHRAAPLPAASVLLRRAERYARTPGRAAAYIATATYAASAEMVRGQQIPWAAWGPCPGGMTATRCARSDVQLWYSGGRGRVQTEGSTAICTPQQTWIINPMAGLADTLPRTCGPLGPDLGALGTTAGIVGALLPTLRSAHARVLGSDVVAGHRCWVVALAAGRLCVDTVSGLALRLERLDRAGQPVASFTMTELSYGLDLAPQIFENPIPGGSGPLVSGLTQPLVDIQVADDMALFTTLVPTWLPSGLRAQTPTFDSFYDQSHDYAPEQRVRQVYADGAGRPALELIETLPGSPWDVTPPAAGMRSVAYAEQRLLEWPAAGGRPAVVRRVADGTAALVSSRILPLPVLERVAAALQ